MGRLVLASWLGLLLVAAPALAADSAAEAASDVTATMGAGLMASLVAAVPAAVAAPVPEASPVFVAASSRTSNDFVAHRPAVLPALYVASAALQGYDAYSTLTALKLGAHEANPLMTSAVNSPAVLIGIKAAMAVSATMTAERMWKHHNRMGAVVVMALSDGLMSFVAVHNTQVVNSLR